MSIQHQRSQLNRTERECFEKYLIKSPFTINYRNIGSGDQYQWQRLATGGAIRTRLTEYLSFKSARFFTR